MINGQEDSFAEFVPHTVHEALVRVDGRRELGLLIFFSQEDAAFIEDFIEAIGDDLRVQVVPDSNDFGPIPIMEFCLIMDHQDLGDGLQIRFEIEDSDGAWQAMLENPETAKFCILFFDASEVHPYQPINEDLSSISFFQVLLRGQETADVVPSRSFFSTAL